MNKIKEIILSYATMLNPTEEQKKIAEIRLATCMKCEEWKENMDIICGACNHQKSGMLDLSDIRTMPLLKEAIKRAEKYAMNSALYEGVPEFATTAITIATLGLANDPP
jgi:hypothetical protein